MLFGGWSGLGNRGGRDRLGTRCCRLLSWGCALGNRLGADNFFVIGLRRFRHGDSAFHFALGGLGPAVLHSRPKPLGYVLIDRAGVGFLFRDTELGQHFDDGVGGNLQLPCELIDANFTHK